MCMFPMECHMQMQPQIWITQSKRAMIANLHDKRIPSKILNRLVEMIEAQSEDIISAWIERFGEIEYYC